MATRWHPGTPRDPTGPHGTPVINGPAVYGSGVSTITILAYIYYQYIIHEWPPHHPWLLGPGCQLVFELRDLYLQRHQSRILLLAQLILNQNTGRSQGHSVLLNHPDSTTRVDASTASTPNYIAVCYGLPVYGVKFTIVYQAQSVWVIPGKHPRASKHDNILQCKSM